MDNNSQQESILNKAIKWLCRDKSFHICIHDASGIIHSLPGLQLPFEHMIHDCRFCDCAKTTAAGMRACLKCKSFSIAKALRVKDTYTGQCYLGISEIVKPVFYNDRLVCIIYAGNFILEQKKLQVIDRIKRICSITGVSEDLLLQALDCAETVTDTALLEYREIVEILYSYILLSLNDNIKLKSKLNNISPIYSNTTHWVVESVQNYVSAYYDRDLKLSHLARLYFMNPQYLCRLFKNKTGTNFSDYVNKVRISNAKQILSVTDEEVANISLKVGFNNVTYFNRLFKKYTGVTPVEYRKHK